MKSGKEHFTQERYQSIQDPIKTLELLRDEIDFAHKYHSEKFIKDKSKKHKEKTAFFSKIKAILQEKPSAGQPSLGIQGIIKKIRTHIASLAASKVTLLSDGHSYQNFTNLLTYFENKFYSLKIHNTAAAAQASAVSPVDVKTPAACATAASQAISLATESHDPFKAKMKLYVDQQHEQIINAELLKKKRRQSFDNNKLNASLRYLVSIFLNANDHDYALDNNYEKLHKDFLAAYIMLAKSPADTMERSRHVIKVYLKKFEAHHKAFQYLNAPEYKRLKTLADEKSSQGNEMKQVTESSLFNFVREVLFKLLELYKTIKSNQLNLGFYSIFHRFLNSYKPGDADVTKRESLETLLITNDGLFLGSPVQLEDDYIKCLRALAAIATNADVDNFILNEIARFKFYLSSLADQCEDFFANPTNQLAQQIENQLNLCKQFLKVATPFLPIANVTFNQFPYWKSANFESFLDEILYAAFHCQPLKGTTGSRIPFNTKKPNIDKAITTIYPLKLLNLSGLVPAPILAKDSKHFKKGSLPFFNSLTSAAKPKPRRETVAISRSPEQTRDRKINKTNSHIKFNTHQVDLFNTLYTTPIPQQHDEDKIVGSIADMALSFSNTSRLGKLDGEDGALIYQACYLSYFLCKFYKTYQQVNNI